MTSIELSQLESRRTGTSLTLLDGLCQQEPDAWQRFVRLYGPVVYHRCRKKGFSDVDACDITQEVLTQVHKSIDQFIRQRSGSFRRWLNSVIRSKMVDHIRRQNRSFRASGGTDVLVALQQVVDIDTEPGSDVGDTAEDDERVLLIRLALSSIRPDFTPKVWQAFWATAVDNRPGPEVAKELGMTPNCVRQAKSRVFHRLRLELDGLIDFSDPLNVNFSNTEHQTLQLRNARPFV